MYQGKHGNDHRGRAPRRPRMSRTVMVALALVLVLGLAIGGTVAYLVTNTSAITNTFTPASVPNTPVEEFDGTTKTSIQVENEGNIAAYVRVKLVTYRVDDNGSQIGGAATIPTFTPANGWFEKGGYYYYTTAVEPGSTSLNLLPTGGIKLQQYTDADGGKQVIEVLTESIQSVPASAVENAWGVAVVNGNLTTGGNA